MAELPSCLERAPKMEGYLDADVVDEGPVELYSGPTDWTRLRDLHKSQEDPLQQITDAYGEYDLAREAKVLLDGWSHKVHLDTDGPRGGGLIRAHREPDPRPETLSALVPFEDRFRPHGDADGHDDSNILVAGEGDTVDRRRPVTASRAGGCSRQLLHDGSVFEEVQLDIQRAVSDAAAKVGAGCWPKVEQRAVQAARHAAVAARRQARRDGLPWRQASEGRSEASPRTPPHSPEKRIAMQPYIPHSSPALDSPSPPQPPKQLTRAPGGRPGGRPAKPSRRAGPSRPKPGRPQPVTGSRTNPADPALRPGVRRRAAEADVEKPARQLSFQESAPERHKHRRPQQEQDELNQTQCDAATAEAAAKAEAVAKAAAAKAAAEIAALDRAIATAAADLARRRETAMAQSAARREEQDRLAVKAAELAALDEAVKAADAQLLVQEEAAAELRLRGQTLSAAADRRRLQHCLAALGQRVQQARQQSGRAGRWWQWRQLRQAWQTLVTSAAEQKTARAAAVFEACRRAEREQLEAAARHCSLRRLGMAWGGWLCGIRILEHEAQVAAEHARRVLSFERLVAARQQPAPADAESSAPRRQLSDGGRCAQWQRADFSSGQRRRQPSRRPTTPGANKQQLLLPPPATEQAAAPRAHAPAAAELDEDAGGGSVFGDSQRSMLGGGGISGGATTAGSRYGHDEILGASSDLGTEDGARSTDGGGNGGDSCDEFCGELSMCSLGSLGSLGSQALTLTQPTRDRRAEAALEALPPAMELRARERLRRREMLKQLYDDREAEEQRDKANAVVEAREAAAAAKREAREEKRRRRAGLLAVAAVRECGRRRQNQCATVAVAHSQRRRLARCFRPWLFLVASRRTAFDVAAQVGNRNQARRLLRLWSRRSREARLRAAGRRAGQAAAIRGLLGRQLGRLVLGRWAAAAAASVATKRAAARRWCRDRRAERGLVGWRAVAGPQAARRRVERRERKLRWVLRRWATWVVTKKEADAVAGTKAELWAQVHLWLDED